MKQRRSGSLLAIILLTSIITLNASADKYFAFSDTGKPTGQYTNITVWNSELYIYRESEGLLRYHLNDAQVDLLLSDRMLLSHGQPLSSSSQPFPILIGGEEGLYMLVDNALWQYNPEDMNLEHLYTATLPDQDEYQAILDYAVVNSTLYAIALNSYGLTDLIKLKEETTELVQQGIVRICQYHPGKILVVTSDFASGKSIAILDVENNILSEVKHLNNEVGKYLFYAPDIDAVYMWNSNVVRRAINFGNFETAFYIPQEQREPLKIVPLPNGNIAINYYDDVLIAEAKPDKIELLPLKVKGYSHELPNQAFVSAHPDIPLELDERYPDNAESMLTDILFGSGADVYVIDSGDYDITVMAQKGYVEDLSSSSLLQEAVNRMYPFIQEIAAPGGRLSALPVRFSATWRLIGYFPSAFSSIGLDSSDIPKTYSDLLVFIKEWQNGVSDEHPEINLFGSVESEVIRDAIIWGILNSEMIYFAKSGEPMALDADRTTALLDQVNSIDWGDSQISSNALPILADSTSSTNLFSTYNLAIEQMDQNLKNGLMPLPLSLSPELEPVTDIRVTMLIVNPNSKNLEGSMKYLEFIRSQQPQAYAIAFSPSINTPIKNPGYNDQVSLLLETISGIEEQMAVAETVEKREMEQQIMQLKIEIADLADDEYFVSPQAIQTYREYAYLLHSVPASVLSKNNDEIQSLIKRYKDGQLPPKQLVDELNRKLKMVQLENR